LLSDQDDQLRLFLRDYVASYEELETLLLLARNAGREWTEGEVALALNATAESIGEALKCLREAGMLGVVQRSGNLLYCYSAGSDPNHERVVELQRAYDERRLNVVQMMSANALERVRGAAMQRLADAFRVERSKK
jgi:hypothetical protein